ncbi:MAG: NADPH:quinone oxidoreductase family protein [Silicimonas sp.]|nr:NADPH:quinone oxidoreductase family protein [Silicimonas sp.]
MTQVKAMVVSDLGAKLVVQESRRSPLNEGEIRLRVLACGLNFADLLLIKGQYQERIAPPFVPGMEICGLVEALGASVDGLKVGQRVACVPGHGGLATHLNVAGSICIPVPDALSNTQAAGFQIAYGTSHMALARRARLQAGETVVVLGAAGGVGLTAVEIAHLMGARVIAVARGATKLDVARAAGADVTIDASDPDLKGRLKAQGPVHVVYDAVGGAMGEAALSALSPEGRFLAIGFASGDIPQVRLNHLLVKNIDVIGFYWGGYTRFNPAALRDSMTTLLGWVAEGRITPHVSHVLPLEQAEDGLELLRSRKATGKVVITP